MNDVERSKLLYLADALTVAPDKKIRLIGVIARGKNNSVELVSELSTLRLADDIGKAVRDLKERLL